MMQRLALVLALSTTMVLAVETAVGEGAKKSVAPQMVAPKAPVKKAPVVKPDINVTAQKAFSIKLDNPESASTGYIWYVTYEPTNPFMALAKVTDNGSIFTFNVKPGRPSGTDFRVFVMFSLVGPGKNPADAEEVVVFPVVFKGKVAKATSSRVTKSTKTKK